MGSFKQFTNSLNNELINYSLKLPRDLWLKAKIKALQQNKKLSEVIRELLSRWVEDVELENETRSNINSRKISQVSAPSYRSQNGKLPDFLRDNPWVDVLARRK
ncbi:MAG: hypothetical protein DRN04_16390 [Thermoprotei archaeon]|nr:MAG: hypothetical protein DRN04_16390 [Thermoprotei archaeon]